MFAQSAEAQPLWGYAFNLQPVAAPASAVRRVATLGDNPFEAVLAGGVEERLAIAFELFRLENFAGAVLKEILKHVPAIVQVHPRQIVAVKIQQVKCAEDCLGCVVLAASAAKRFLQRAEIRTTFLVENDSLAVEDHRRAERFRLSSNRRKAIGLIVAPRVALRARLCSGGVGRAPFGRIHSIRAFENDISFWRQRLVHLGGDEGATQAGHLQRRNENLV
jgi:hypothetical protein